MCDNNEAVTLKQLTTWFRVCLDTPMETNWTHQNVVTHAQQCGVPTTWQPLVVGLLFGYTTSDWQCEFKTQ